MGKERAEARQGRRLASPGNLFSPSRLEIKRRQIRRTNCLGRMTARAIGAGQWRRTGGKSTKSFEGRRKSALVADSHARLMGDNEQGHRHDQVTISSNHGLQKGTREHPA
jgi:hypothetical protein